MILQVHSTCSGCEKARLGHVGGR